MQLLEFISKSQQTYLSDFALLTERNQLTLMKKTLFVFAGIFLFTCSFGQRDLISWTAFKIETSIDEKTKFAFKPIVRHKDDLSTYQNTSVDFVVNRKLGNKWFGQVIYRHWFWPDEPRINFIWFDLGYNTVLNDKLKSSTAARIHWSLSEGRQSADFIRVREKITFGKGKVKPNIQIEGWMNIDQEVEFSVFRIEPGLAWSIAPGVSLTMNYRIQTKYGVHGPSNQDHLVSSVNYSF